MYVYQYETLETGGGMWIDNAACGHREIIDAYARDGWRYVGFAPTRFSSYGGIKAIDLIFEKQKEDG